MYMYHSSWNWSDVEIENRISWYCTQIRNPGHYLNSYTQKMYCTACTKVYYFNFCFLAVNFSASCTKSVAFWLLNTRDTFFETSKLHGHKTSGDIRF